MIESMYTHYAGEDNLIDLAELQKYFDDIVADLANSNQTLEIDSDVIAEFYD